MTNQQVKQTPFDIRTVRNPLISIGCEELLARIDTVRNALGGFDNGRCRMVGRKGPSSRAGSIYDFVKLAALGTLNVAQF